MTDQSRLLVGGPHSGPAARISIADVLAGRSHGNRYESVVLQPRLEDLGDPWPLLRALWHWTDDGGTLSVRFGQGRHRLRRASVRSLLRLCGYRPSRTRRSGGVVEIEARREPRVAADYSCSIVVPCRNEVENVAALADRVPAIGTHTELIFVDGASTDGTPHRIREVIASRPDRDIKLLEQASSSGKAGAVFQGFDAASGDILIILDADMTVAPEDLPRFYLAIAEGVADFANGTRFVYPMEAGAMRPLNNVGNRAFGTFFSWLLGARVSDSLCGTKALLRRDWPAVRDARPLFGGHDPWGDFDLLLGAAYSGLRLVDVPVRYGARVAGESKMHPLRHGLALARTCLSGARRLKLEHRPSR